MEKLAPPFNDETARAKVQRAEDLWNTKDPIKVAQAYTPDCQWRNRDIFLTGRDAIVEFLTSKWALERQYKLRKRLFCHDGANKLAVEFEYEFVDEGGQWWRAYGLEHWTFNNDGIMERRDMSANNIAIHESERSI